ncbi:MAG: hypothetical protein ACKVH0_15640 [Alphaproteobacteria bacterium]
MAATPEAAIQDAIDASGSLKVKKFRETIHLPLHQVGVGPALPPIYLEEADVPEYRSDGWAETNPEWVGSTNELRACNLIVADENKAAYLIKAARFYADGRLMQTYGAIFTVANKNGDWRLISRNPFNVQRA